MSTVTASNTPIRKRISSFDLASPVRRRSEVLTKKKINDIVNDDNAERVKRRNVAELHRKITSSPITPVPNEQFGNIQEHFETCLRMFTQNKINTKNVWNIHILDYMRSLVQSNTELRNMLQIAGTSLDIGAKVYSLRVDDVHSEVLKLANTLTSVNVHKRSENDGNIDNELNNRDQNCEQLEKVKKKKKARNYDLDSANRITITENEDSLNGSIQKYGLFQPNKEDNNNMLNLTLFKMPGHSFELLVASRARNVQWIDGSNRKEPESTQIQHKLDSLPVVSICPSLRNYSVDIWDEDEENVILSRLQDEVHHNENGFPIPDLDLENNDPNDDDIDDDHFEDIECNAQFRHGTDFITDMKPQYEPAGSTTTLEYSYRRPPVLIEEFNIVGVWAGPAHWKFKSLRKAINTTAKSTESKTKYKNTKSTPTPFAFDSQKMLNNSYKDQFLQKFLHNNEKVRLTRKLATNVLESSLLPQDLQLNMNVLFPLNFKNNFKVPIRKSANLVNDLNVSTYVYDNPNDNEYCNKTVVDVGWEEDGDGDAGHISHGEDEVENDIDHESFDNDLIAAPDMVPQTFVNYARRAKKMDMKKLKIAMWEEMTGIDLSKYENVLEHNKMVQDIHIKPTSLWKVYKKLPQKLSTIMIENLSGPLAFVALLHLCNENELQLEATADLSDIIIKKE